jgi:hypothetical protein
MISISHRRADGHLTIIVAEAGERQITLKTMNTNQFSLANRKQLADLLADKYDSLRSKAKSKLREKRQEFRQSLVKEYAEKKGALKVVAQIVAVNEKLKALEDELLTLGYTLDRDDDLDLAGNAGQSLRKIIDARVDKELGTPDDIDARFDSTQLAMMTVASLEDAEKLLKSVSSI